MSHSLDMTSSSASRTEIEQAYKAEHDRLDSEIRKLTAVAALLTTIRGLLLLGTIVLGVVGWAQWNSVWWYAAGAIGCAFLAVAAYQENSERKLHNERTLRLIFSHSLARMRRNWKRLPRISPELPDSRQAVVGDLDLFGQASLFDLVCVARTPHGINTLRDWILNVPTTSDVQSRQSAVAKLAPMHDWRVELQKHAEQLAASKSGPEAMIAWAESPSWYGRRPWLLWLCRILTVAFLGIAMLLVMGAIDKQWGGIAIAVICGFNFLLTVVFAGSIHPIFNQVSSRQNDVALYRSLFHLIERLPKGDPFLDSIHELTRVHDRSAMEPIQRLGTVMALANLRRGGFFGLLYLILQFLVLWDFHALDLLERWQKKFGPHVRNWFDGLGRAEAIACLAKLHHDEPEWQFPSVVDFESTSSPFSATRLGHPLIAESDRVSNDVGVGPSGTVLLVTGSNMSGKSTLLRALGLNIVLAQAGAPVCASKCRSPLVQIETSMRISDSLKDGVSFFMAELKRLKQVVDSAAETNQVGKHGFFYLLDEILQGTNSRERHIAVQEVIRHLIGVKAIGAVSTHDLDLATAEGLADHCKPVHFRETIETGGEKRMTFDYILREGVATTSNALKLLELVGLHRHSDERPNQAVVNES